MSDQQLNALRRIRISDPDADGRTWITAMGETATGSVSVPADSIQGRAFAELKAMLQAASEQVDGNTP